MNNLHPLLSLIIGGLLAVVLHLLLGRAQKSWLQKLDSVSSDDGAPPDNSLRKLYVEWGAKGLRTFIWLVFFIFALQLIPTLQNDLRAAQDEFKKFLTRMSDWLLGSGLSAVVVMIVTIFLMRFASALIKTTFAVYEKRIATQSGEHLKRRAQTLSTIFSGLAQATIFFIGLMVALQQGGLNITPILASAGLLGLAIGFGAQSLIKDIFAGVMILFEEQYSVGDTIKIGEVSGTVEALTLRATRVRGGDGALTIFPNGNIATVANLSKEWMRVVLDYELDYSADVDLAMKIMSEVAAQLQAERPTEFLEDPVMQGLEKVANGNLTLRLIFKTLPSKHAEIGRELRRRVKIAFDAAGIKGAAKPDR